MRRLAGWALVFAGFLAAAVGIVAAVVVGPDDAISSGVRRLTSSGAAIVTAPGAITYAGPTVSIDVTSAGGPVFVGVGREVDVADLVADTSRTEVDQVSVPWSIRSSAAKGSSTALPDVSGLDWWLASDSGSDASVVFGLPDEPISVLVMNADGSPAVDVDVTAAVSVAGFFWGALALLVLGVGLELSGFLVLRRRPTASPPGHRGGAE